MCKHICFYNLLAAHIFDKYVLVNAKHLSLCKITHVIFIVLEVFVNANLNLHLPRPVANYNVLLNSGVLQFYSVNYLTV